MRIRFLAALVLSPLLLASSLAADTTEYNVKAGFVLNFLKLTTFSKTIEPNRLFLCVAAPEHAREAFRALDGIVVMEKKIEIKFNDDQRCDATFLSKNATAKLRKSFSSISETTPTFGIVETAEDFDRGGCISLFSVDRRIRFRVALDRVKKKGLKLSSQLLRLAEIVDKL